MALPTNAQTDALFDALLRLQDAEECRMFLEDLCTIKEVQNMAQRLDVAIMLDAGKNYQEITRETSVSTATISRVSRCLNYGSGGYRIALERLKKAADGK
jgi:TrpR-related protein YerC/YecD